MSLGSVRITGHCLAIVGNKNSRRFCGNDEYLGIAYANNNSLLGAEDIDGGLPPAKANYDFVVEIGVRLEAGPHALDV